MSANIHIGQTITIDLHGQPSFAAEVTEVIFEGTSHYVDVPGKAWRELLIVDTPTGIALRDRVRESRHGKDRTISCDWQMFENADVCLAWLDPGNKLEGRACTALARHAA